MLLLCHTYMGTIWGPYWEQINSIINKFVDCENVPITYSLLMSGLLMSGLLMSGLLLYPLILAVRYCGS